MISPERNVSDSEGPHQVKDQNNNSNHIYYILEHRSHWHICRDGVYQESNDSDNEDESDHFLLQSFLFFDDVFSTNSLATSGDGPTPLLGFLP